MENKLDFIIKIFGILGTLSGFIVWVYMILDKRRERLLERREADYEILISHIRSFGIGAFNPEKDNRFFETMHKVWTYGSDKVILSCNSFVKAIEEKRDQKYINEKKAI